MSTSPSRGSKALAAVAALDAFPFGSASALCRALRARKVSSVELLKAYLERVDRLNPRINAIVVDDRERALAQARAADRALARGKAIGPLHGLPMTVKEAFDLEGHPTTHGYPPMRDNLAAQDALAVQRLKAAGAVVFGKSNVPLFNADLQSYNEIYGMTSNPWDTARGPGGSSGGSAAAVAAGLTGLEFGSDIGGSIRNPAAFCGVYGHKSTWGIVPKRGHHLSRVPIAEAGPVGDRTARALGAGPRAGAGRNDRSRPAHRSGAALQIASAAACAEGPAGGGLAGRTARADRRQRARADPRRGDCTAPRRREGGLRRPAGLRRAQGARHLQRASAGADGRAPARLRPAARAQREARSVRPQPARRSATCVDGGLQGVLRRQQPARAAALGLARVLRPIRRDAGAGHGDRRVPARPFGAALRRARCR